MEALRIVSALRSFRYSYGNEIDFQDGIAAALTASQIQFDRECDLGGLGIIDFLCCGIGIEAKIKGNRQSLFRQVARYTQHAGVREVIIASAKNAMIRGAPSSLNGKTVTSVFLGGIA